MRAEQQTPQAPSDRGGRLRVFISYRREDAPDAAGRLYDTLVDHFGNDSIVIDVDTIEPGLDFVEVIESTVASCDVLIAVIGRGWLTATDPDGRRRLDKPDDFVRIEIEAALSRDVRVIPVLLNAAGMPRSDELPESLSLLARRNALEIDYARWRDDVRRLINTLERLDVAKLRPEPETEQTEPAELRDSVPTLFLGSATCQPFA
jgi:hypothetical protein